MGKEETKAAEARTRGEGRLYRRAKSQSLQFRLICFSTLVQPAALSSLCSLISTASLNGCLVFTHAGDIAIEDLAFSDHSRVRRRIEEVTKEGYQGRIGR